MQISTVLFDLDGTLLDTLLDLVDSTNAALSANGLPTRSFAEVRRFVGNGVADLIRRAVPEGLSPAAEAKCLADFRAHYLTNMQHKTAPYPGALALLDQLSVENIKLAVVSNKFDGAVKALCEHYFGVRFAVAVGEMQGIAKKPAPDLVRKAMVALDADPTSTVYVGDSEVDIATARNAGLPCISVTWGFRDRAFLTERGASLLIDKPAELLGIFVNEGIVT